MKSDRVEFDTCHFTKTCDDVDYSCISCFEKYCGIIKFYIKHDSQYCVICEDRLVGRNFDFVRGVKMITNNKLEQSEFICPPCFNKHIGIQPELKEPKDDLNSLRNKMANALRIPASYFGPSKP